MSRKRFALALLLVSGIPAGAVYAQEDQTIWRCWYEGRGAIVCAVQQVATTAGTNVVEALSPLTPAILHTVRNDPASLIGRFVIIPLHTLPFDSESPARLARITVCGARPDCQLRYSATRPADIDMAALMDGDRRY